MELKILEKAYEVDFKQIKEGFLASNEQCYAKTRNEARKKLLCQIAYDDWIIKDSLEKVNYLNIPVIRLKENDILNFSGKQIKRWELKEYLIHKKRYEELDKILNNKNIIYCYKVKGRKFYKLNNCGYTQYSYKAGIYTKEDAVSDAKNSNKLWVRPINIEEHNKNVLNEIEILKKSIIKKI